MRIRTAFALAALPALGLAPTAAADNGRVFYVSGAYTTASTVMSACTSGFPHTKAVVPSATFPTASPDGKRIAYNKLKSSGANDGVWVANADGSDPVQIEDGKWSPYLPAWSPDGKKLTYRRYVQYDTSVMQPVVADIATKTVTPLLTDKNISMATEGAAPNVWTPDGSTILFLGSADPTGSDVYQVSASGGTAIRILGNAGVYPFYQHIDLSRDGKTLLEQHQPGDEVPFETWRRPFPDGPNPSKLFSFDPTTGVGDEGAVFSPDGTRLVFSRGPSGALMSSAPDGTGVQAVGAGVGGALPFWSTNVDDCTDPGAATMRVNEIGPANAPFVELLDPADETFPSDQGPYRVVVYDAAGARQGAHAVSSALLQGRDNTKPLLLSSAAANAAYGVTGDETLSVGLPMPGQACFTKGAGETKVDCVSWGCVATPVSVSSTRIPMPAGGVSSQRQGIGSATFHLATPTPKAANVAGTATAACVPPASGGGGDPTPLPSGDKPAVPRLTITSGATVKVAGAAAAFKLACAAAACTGKATLTTVVKKRTTLGSATVRIAAGKTATIKVKLKKPLRRGARVKAKLTVTLAGGATVTKTVTLRA